MLDFHLMIRSRFSCIPMTKKQCRRCYSFLYSCDSRFSDKEWAYNVYHLNATIHFIPRRKKNTKKVIKTFIKGKETDKLLFLSVLIDDWMESVNDVLFCQDVELT